jgi:prepilin-type N-terminal cleavage/methylation domain-containing protein
MALSRRQRGFSLIELVMVIVILGVVGATVAVFMRKPVDAYVDTSRRAALSDLADTAVRRIARDVRRALPNSVRNPSNQCIEFIPTRTGGRYRPRPPVPVPATSWTSASPTRVLACLPICPPCRQTSRW